MTLPPHADVIEPSTVNIVSVSCFKRKKNSLKRGKRRGGYSHGDVRYAIAYIVHPKALQSSLHYDVEMKNMNGHETHQMSVLSSTSILDGGSNNSGARNGAVTVSAHNSCKATASFLDVICDRAGATEPKSIKTVSSLASIRMLAGLRSRKARGGSCVLQLKLI